MANVNLTAVSLFSGCGGFDLGAQEAGVKIIWANDINQHAATTYKTLFPDVEFVLDDVANISSFPKADILIGCYPCTGFSLASRRRWRKSEVRDLKADERNFLYRHFLRALEQIKPRYAFIENVGGMITANNGSFLEEQIYHFSRLKYKAQYKRLNANDFGVPQSRQRVFFALTHYDLLPFEYEFPKPTHGPEGSKPYNVLRDAIWGMEEWPKGEFWDYKFHGHYLTRNRKRRWDELSYTIVANMDHVPLHPMGKPMKFIKADTWELQGKKNRRLSWRECAAIQGLPTQLLPSGYLKNNYRVVGNAVPPPFGKALLEPIVRFELGR